MNIRVSIAMCTYNGARYVGAQIKSFLSQNYQPDELIICDNGSVDETESIVDAYRSTAGFPIHFHRNVENLGFARNFEKAASLVTGDVVFFSDQDDVWHETKIAEMVSAFIRDRDVGLVFCDADLVDEKLDCLGQRYWDRQRFSDSLQNKIEGVTGARLLLRDPTQMAAGATMAYSAHYAPSIFPLPAGWTHDAWIATVVAAQAKVVLVREPLNSYRQHVTQVYGASSTPAGRRQGAKMRSRSTDHFVQTAARYGALLDRLEKRATLDADFLEQIRSKIEHWESRAKMRTSHIVTRWALVIRELVRGRYTRYSQGWRSAAMDTLY